MFVPFVFYPPPGIPVFIPLFIRLKISNINPALLKFICSRLYFALLYVFLIRYSEAMKKKYGYILLLLLVLPLILLGVCNFIIEETARGKTFSNIDELPANKVGLILGTARGLTKGGLNPFYTNRITATVALYEAGKIQYVLVSGDNSSLYYNEPIAIKKDLVKAGIPEDCIFLDYAGFRTLDSMVRAKAVFGLNSVTVISQEFHNERAIFLAERKGLEAIGFNARDLAGGQGQNVRFREYFARVKVFVDLLLNTQPKYYGERIEIE